MGGAYCGEECRRSDPYIGGETPNRSSWLCAVGGVAGIAKRQRFTTCVLGGGGHGQVGRKGSQGGDCAKSDPWEKGESEKHRFARC